MSYCRFSEGDVYLYRDATIPDFLVCCFCKLATPRYGLPGDTGLVGEIEALEHLKEHQKAGHSVPQRAFDRLEEELRRSTA